MHSSFKNSPNADVQINDTEDKKYHCKYCISSVSIITKLFLAILFCSGCHWPLAKSHFIVAVGQLEDSLQVEIPSDYDPLESAEIGRNDSGKCSDTIILYQPPCSTSSMSTRFKFSCMDNEKCDYVSDVGIVDVMLS